MTAAVGRMTITPPEGGPWYDDIESVQAELDPALASDDTAFVSRTNLSLPPVKRLQKKNDI